MTTALSVRLADAIAAAGLSQKDVASRLGVARSTVTHWCSGRNAPDIEAIERIAEILGVEPSTLAFGPTNAKTGRRPGARSRTAGPARAGINGTRARIAS